MSPMTKLGKILLLLALIVAPVGCAVDEDDTLTPAGPPVSTGGGGNSGELGGSVGNATGSANP